MLSPETSSYVACRKDRYRTEQNINEHLPFPFERFRSYTLSRADYAVGRSAEAVSILRAKGYQGQVEVVPNAVDDSLFRPLDRKACRKNLNLSGFVAGYVGRLVEEKGLLDMVEALPFCPPEINLLFVGAGNFSGVLTKRAEQLDLSHRVRIEDARPLAELPEVMNAIDVLVLPSRTTPSWKEEVLVGSLSRRKPAVQQWPAPVPVRFGGCTAKVEWFSRSAALRCLARRFAV